MFKSIIKFFHEARVELAKVTWPTRRAAINLTLIVVTVSILFMLYTAAVDYGLTTGIKWLTIWGQQITNTSNTSTTSPDIQIGDVKTETTPAK